MNQKSNHNSYKDFWEPLQRKSWRITIVLALIVVLASGGIFLLDRIAAVSVLIGGVIYLVPHSYQVWRIFNRQEFGTPKAAVVDLYLGEVWKVLIYIILLALALRFVQPVSPLSIFLTFALLQILNTGLQALSDKRFLKL